LQQQHRNLFPAAKGCDAVPAPALLHHGLDGVSLGFAAKGLLQIRPAEFEIGRRKQAEKTCRAILVGILVELDIHALHPRLLDQGKHGWNQVLILLPDDFQVADLKLHPALAGKVENFLDTG